MIFLLACTVSTPDETVSRNDVPVGTGCLYGVRDMMGIDWTMILADDPDGVTGQLYAGGNAAPLESYWFELDAAPSECGVQDGISAGHYVPWPPGAIPQGDILDACLADATIDDETGTLVLAEDRDVGLTGYWMAEGGFQATALASSADGALVVGGVSYGVEVSGSIDGCTLALAGETLDAIAHPGWKYGSEQPVSLAVEAPDGSNHVFALGGIW